MFLENNKNFINKFNIENTTNTKNTKPNGISNNNTSNNSKISLVKSEKNPGDNLLKRKIIKIKEKNKASMTVSNTHNNSNSIINSTVNHTNQSNYSNSNNISNYLPNSNYINKMKNKISLENSLSKNKYVNSNNSSNTVNQYQKRSNSALDENNKHNNYYNHNNSNTKSSNIYNKYISSSSSKQHSSIKTQFNPNNHSNHYGKPSHIKNSSLFSSTLASLSKPKYSNHNSTTKSGSNSNSNITNKQINKYYFGIKTISKTSYPTKTNSRKHSMDKERKSSGKVQKSNIINNSGNTNNTKIKNESAKNSSTKQISSGHAKGLSEIPLGFNNITNCLNKCKNFVNKDSGKNIIKENNKNYEIALESKPISSNLSTKKKEIKVKEKVGKTGTIKSDQVKNEKNEPDCDLNNTQNRNDSLLEYINANIDIGRNNQSMINESFDSIHSSLRGDTRMFYRDMELICSYISKFFIKYKKYPTTKMKFYKYGRLLGKGAFGKVNLSLHVLTGRLVAIKSINKTRLTSERQKSKIAQETNIMKSLSHSNYIVKIFETYETQKHICIVMEYICAGDLLSYIRKRSKLSETIAKYIFKQIVLGLQYIHSKGIVHRDIKLDNILIDLDNNIKICDFGVSKKIRKGESMTEQCGTPAYIAPEILKNKGYEGFGVDIWSAGVVLYAMLSGIVPFKGKNLQELQELIMQGNFKPVSEVSKEANHLIKCLLEVDPKKRISVNNILQHPWLIGVDINNKNYNLFTNAERVILVKSNIDYRDTTINNKEDMLEIFSIKNIDTGEENENKNANSKSLILAPYNSSMTESISRSLKIGKPRNKKDQYDLFSKELVIQNNIIKFNGKVKEINRNYELNNNEEIDNGVIISPNISDDNLNGKDNIIIENNKDNSPIIKSSLHSKPFSPFGEFDDAYSKKENDIEISTRMINENAITEMCRLGYNRNFLIDCIEKNEINYATTGYYLLVKYCVSN